MSLVFHPLYLYIKAVKVDFIYYGPRFHLAIITMC